MASTSAELLASLPETFRYSEALDRITERQFRRLKDNGASSRSRVACTAKETGWAMRT